MANKKQTTSLEAPLLHENHKKPVTRREFLGAGLISGSAMVMTPSILSLLNSGTANAATPTDCGLGGSSGGKVPFICIDLGGGANITGSNVLVGGPGGQLDFLSTAGYSKLGLPPAFLPNLAKDGRTDQIDATLGLAFHSDSAFLRGIQNKFTNAAGIANTNGAIIPARSDNDTSNNPHNPMYGISKAGADGDLLTLIGTRNSESGGRSVAPADMIDPTKRPTKIDRPSDSTGLVETGDLAKQMSQADAATVMLAIERISSKKIDLSLSPAMYNNDRATLEKLIHCGYLKSTDAVSRFAAQEFDPLQDVDIQAIYGVSPTVDFANNRDQKTASVMNMVVKGFAGAGTIEMGGYDYHNGTRGTGENRDFQAGETIGACLEFAARRSSPLMIYVFTDGSLASNGSVNGDETTAERGKGVWTGDNSSTSAGFFLVYSPAGRPVLMSTPGQTAEQHQQLGYFRSSASVETSGTTPGANNVNLLVEMVVLNYMALHGEQGQFPILFPNNGLGTNLDRLTAFQPIV